MTKLFDEGYERLYAAIYKLAAKDDRAEVKRRLRNRLAVRGVSKTKVEAYIKANDDLIRQSITKGLHKEAQIWNCGETRRLQLQNIDSLVDKLVRDFRRQNDK